MGISADPVDLQLEFKLENALDYPLLSDRDGSIQKQFGTSRWGPLPGKRATFVIAADGTLVAKISSETNANVHADDALDALRQNAA
ncbi:MAG: peroxiredoxin Q/BCP [Verrucomicrobiales bacterium]